MSEARRRPDPKPTRVVRTERISESLVRIVASGDALAGFAPEHADSYVKIVFPPAPDAPDRARMRTYTVRRFDPDTRELTVDVVLHGDVGLAGPWAAQLQPGDEMPILGPGGDYTPPTDADWHLLAGDESALPAIAVALERLPDDAVGQAFVEVHGPADEIPLAHPAGVTVTWLHRGTGSAGTRLVEAVLGWSVPSGAGHWFVHGEAAAVRAVRRYLRFDLGLPMSRLSVSGYWRAGSDDEQWRAVKRDWNREVDEAEAALV